MTTDKFLSRGTLDIDPKLSTAPDEWDMWSSNFKAYIEAIYPGLNPDKLKLLRAIVKPHRTADQDVFFSQSLASVEHHLSVVKQEAFVSVKVLHKWHQFLFGRHFQLITDQQSVQNKKILCWQSELYCFRSDIS